MQNKLSEIVDMVWDLADLSMHYGRQSFSADTGLQSMSICGLVCEFSGNDITRVHAADMDLHLNWNSNFTANDNGGDNGIENNENATLRFSEIFPNSVTFTRGNVKLLEKWHKELSVLQGTLVA